MKIKISAKLHQKSSTTTSLQTLTPPSLSKIEQRYARSPKVFYPPDGVSPFSRGVTCTRACVSLALLSLRKNGGLLIVYLSPELYDTKFCLKKKKISLFSKLFWVWYCVLMKLKQK